MKKLLSNLLLSAVGLSALSALSAASAQTKWDLPTGYAVGSFQTENVQLFANISIK